MLVAEECGGRLLQSSFDVCIEVHEKAPICIKQALLTRLAPSVSVLVAVDFAANATNSCKKSVILVEVDTAFYITKDLLLPP